MPALMIQFNSSAFNELVDNASVNCEKFGISFMNATTQMGAEEAKKFINVDTGDLRDSLEQGPTESDGKQIVGSFGTNVYYAGYQNYGYTSARGYGPWIEGTHFMEAGEAKMREYLGEYGQTYLLSIFDTKSGSDYNF